MGFRDEVCVNLFTLRLIIYKMERNLSSYFAACLYQVGIYTRFWATSSTFILYIFKNSKHNEKLISHDIRKSKNKIFLISQNKLSFLKKIT